MIKIAFLFLTTAGVFHETYWSDFLRGYEEAYSMYVHSKNGVPQDSFFKPFELANPEMVNAWGNLMWVQRRLLKEALADPENEYFIFLSDSAIPIQTFETVYETITDMGKSFLSFHTNPHLPDGRYPQLKRVFDPIPRYLQQKSEVWSIVTRDHAQRLVDDQLVCQFVSKAFANEEHYVPTLLACHGLLEREAVYGDACAVNWERADSTGSMPYSYYNLNDPYQMQCVAKAVKAGYLFMRKFPAKTDLSPIDHLLAYRSHSNR